MQFTIRNKNYILIEVPSDFIPQKYGALDARNNIIWGKNSHTLLAISFFLLIIYLMQCAKRYHDINKWGINGFVWWTIPILNFL